jgi:phage terminase small subunit
MFKNRETGLTEKQEAFCVEVVKSPNANMAEAYRIAFDAGRLTPQARTQNACKLLDKPQIIARIADLRANAVRETEITIEKVLDEICCIAFLDPLTAYDADGNMLPIHEMPERTRRAIRSIEVFQNGRVNIKFHDKVQALERLMRFLGMFAKDNAQRVRDVFDNMTRPQLKHLEACLLELARQDEIELAATENGGDTKH